MFVTGSKNCAVRTSEATRRTLPSTPVIERHPLQCGALQNLDVPTSSSAMDRRPFSNRRRAFSTSARSSPKLLAISAQEVGALRVTASELSPFCHPIRSNFAQRKQSSSIRS
jgi:hypothetical protein